MPRRVQPPPETVMLGRALLLTILLYAALGLWIVHYLTSPIGG